MSLFAKGALAAVVAIGLSAPAFAQMKVRRGQRADERRRVDQ